MNNGSIFLISRVLITYFFNDGSISNASGGCKILMNRDFRIEWIDCRLSNYQSTVNVLNIDKIWDSIPYKNDLNEFKQEFMNKLKQDILSYKSSSTSGIDSGSMRIMQVADVMSSLKSLMGFTFVNNVNSPLKSLELFMTANSNYQAQMQNQKNLIQQKDNSPVEDDKLKKRRISVSTSNANSPLNPDNSKRRK